jgi:hypothetical protein
MPDAAKHSHTDTHAETKRRGCARNNAQFPLSFRSRSPYTGEAPDPELAMTASSATKTVSPEPASLIMLQFLAWVADRPRTYRDTMDAWHSTCPRLSVWEDAIIDGLVCLENNAARAVRLTPRGCAILESAQATWAAQA